MSCVRRAASAGAAGRRRHTPATLLLPILLLTCLAASPLTPARGQADGATPLPAETSLAHYLDSAARAEGYVLSYDIAALRALPRPADPAPGLFAALEGARLDFEISDDGAHVSVRPAARAPLVTDTAYVVAALPAVALTPLRSDSAARPAVPTARYAAATLGRQPATGLDLVPVGGVGVGAGPSPARAARPRLRGASATATGIDFAGLPLYRVEHARGLLPALDPAWVEPPVLYRGHYPAAVGGYTGGLLRYPAAALPAVPGLGGEVAASPQFGRATLTRVGADAYVRAGGRTTWRELAQTTRRGAADDPAAIIALPAVSFGDAHLRAGYRWPRRRLSVDVYGYAGRDAGALDIDPEGDAAPAEAPGGHTSRYRESSVERTRALGATVRFTPARTTYRLSAYATTARERYDGEATRFTDATSGSAADTLTLSTYYANELSDRQLGLSATLPGGLEVGAQLQTLGAVAVAAYGATVPLAYDQADTRAHAYAEYGGRLGNATEVTAALRGTYANRFGTPWLSPRVRVRRLLATSAKHTLAAEAGYSYTRQALRGVQQDNAFGQPSTLWVLQLDRTDRTSGCHTATLGARLTGSRWVLGVEGYYRRLGSVVANLRQAGAAASAADSLAALLLGASPEFAVAEGEGRSFGVDVDLDYAWSRWRLRSAYSLAWSDQRFAADAWLPAPDDRRHRWASGLAYAHGAWAAGLDYEFASGPLFTDVSALLDAATANEPAGADRARSRLPAYHRVDLRAGHEHALTERLGLRTSLRLYNAFDRANRSVVQQVAGPGAADVSDGATGAQVELLRRTWLAEVALTF